MLFKHYPAERLAIESISSRLTAEENTFRKWLMEYSINRGIPYTIHNSNETQTQTFDTHALIEKLVHKKAIVLDEKGNINFIYPVSALPTHHKVYLEDGRSFCAMCAIDAMGSAFTFKQDIRIESKCNACGKKVSMQIENDHLIEFYPENTHILHVDLNRVDNWSGSC